MEAPQLIWDAGTAYDMFVSLEVLHEPDRYGLRGSWAAGVRSRLPTEERELLHKVMHSYVWPLPWVTTLPAPKDGATVLEALAQIAPAERLRSLVSYYLEPALGDVLFNVAEQGSWGEGDKRALRDFYQAHYAKAGEKKKPLADEEASSVLEVWSEAEAYGEGFLAALQTYYDVFFAEEEERIRPALEAAVAQAKKLAEELPLPALLEELSQGLRFTEVMAMKQLVLAPSFWITPLAIFASLGHKEDESMLFVFGGRPADASLVPGEAVPDLLFQTLKALADPTRLRILRYLSAEPLTPAQLSRRLRLRAPTVIHHLHALRLARLVHLIISHEGRRYEARREAIRNACAMLDEYLDQGTME